MCEPGVPRRVALAFAGLLVVAACARTPMAPPPPAGSVEPWVAHAEQLRSLEFVKPVPVKWIRSSDVGDLTRAEMEADLPPGFVETYRDAYATLGVLPPHIDLLQSLMLLHEDQLVGLYSTRLRTMYVVRDGSCRSYARPAGNRALERARGVSAGASSCEAIDQASYAILVHELIHALQHQHFPQTIDLLTGLRRSDDVISSISAAMEGDASVTMFGLMFGDKREAGVSELSRGMLEELVHPAGVMAEVPNFLRSSLIFPYAYGVLEAGRRWDADGNAGLDAMVASPPLSTRALLYPDDPAPVEMVGLPLASLAPTLEAQGCAVEHDNVAGVLTLRVLFEDRDAAETLEPVERAWRGDRFAHVRCGDAHELLWLTRWSDEEAAADFAERYEAIALAIAAGAGLASTPRPTLDGATVVVSTAGVAQVVPTLLEESRVRSYETFGDWVADDCFPESPCPSSDGAAD